MTGSKPNCTGGWPAHHPWHSDQVTNAATILTIGHQLGVPPRGWTIALATAMQESSLRNLPGGDRDSIGLFQQRPSQGWGTPAQLRDPDEMSETCPMGQIHENYVHRLRSRDRSG